MNETPVFWIGVQRIARLSSKGEVWHSNAKKVAAFCWYASSFFMAKALAFFNVLQ